MFYPKCVFEAADQAERQEILAGNAEQLDHEAAAMLESVADHHRDDWQRPQHAVYARRVLRQVASWLKERQ